ncbi:MAG: hypothetical protein J0H09_04035 [Burkholderiales bacterium]|nr:hypothetical protein [Burkholderiales bacterium]ODU52913.1 MAG: hypothetical protein ABT09_02290 [bacterium SCN 57-13]
MPRNKEPIEQAGAADVQVVYRTARSDVYVGTAQALIAAGIIAAEQLPKPGTHMASYLPDGRRSGRGTAKGAYNLEGFRRVSPRAKGRYQVVVTVSEEEQKRRQAEAFEAARPAPSNVIQFPLERCKARPVVAMGLRPIPAARIHSAIETAAGFMVGWTNCSRSEIADGARQAVSMAFRMVFEDQAEARHD